VADGDDGGNDGPLGPKLPGPQADWEADYLWDITPEYLERRTIQTGIHCFACAAGAGSSCTGALSPGDGSFWPRRRCSLLTDP